MVPPTKITPNIPIADVSGNELELVVFCGDGDGAGVGCCASGGFAATGDGVSGFGAGATSSETIRLSVS